MEEAFSQSQRSDSGKFGKIVRGECGLVGLDWMSCCRFSSCHSSSRSFRPSLFDFLMFCFIDLSFRLSRRSEKEELVNKNILKGNMI
jgi:hypothetical protein